MSDKVQVYNLMDFPLRLSGWFVGEFMYWGVGDHPGTELSEEQQTLDFLHRLEQDGVGFASQFLKTDGSLCVIFGPGIMFKTIMSYVADNGIEDMRNTNFTMTSKLIGKDVSFRLIPDSKTPPYKLVDNVDVEQAINFYMKESVN